MTDVPSPSRAPGHDAFSLKELLEQAPGLMCYLRGPELVFEVANAAFLQLAGHRDILGKPAREALAEPSAREQLELFERAFAEGRPVTRRSLRVDLQRTRGAPLEEAYVDLVCQPIRGKDGAVAGVLAQGHEVTETKRQEALRAASEAALRASEERYRTLFESIDHGFCLMQMIVDDTGKTVDYRFLETNAAFEAHTGLVHAVGKTARELVPDLDESWFRLYGRVADTGEATRFENHAPAMGRWFEVYANRVGTPSLRQVALVFKDITRQKKSDDERAALYASESAARREAEQANRLKDEFLATVSHELRNPLNSMLGWLSLLRTGSLAPEKRERSLEIVERNARAQAQLIDDLLDVSRILAGKLRIEVEPVDVDLFVNAALDSVRPAAQAKGVRLQPALSSGCVVMGDAQRLQQVAWNLLSNAVKFTPKGGRVQILVEKLDSAVEITVADTGVGIAAEFQPYVFDRFRQADGGTSRAHGGLGLGLSIVRQLVELHGGTISVYSEGPGHGASFTVRLPLALARGRSVRPSLALSALRCPPELEGLRVLVVDDEPDAREMVRELLVSCKAHVEMAASVAEALACFDREVPDVLVSDVGMPDADGYALIGAVRKRAPERGRDVPALALTAYARSEDRTRALLSGFTSHVPKPVDPLELVAAVASLGKARRKPDA